MDAWLAISVALLLDLAFAIWIAERPAPRWMHRSSRHKIR